MSTVKIGIIGGSGLDNPDILDERQEKSVDTPFGKPSDVLIVGKIKGVDCVLLARHGRTHSIYPTGINYRANIWAMKQEGCTHLIVTTACGSLQEEYVPGDIVFLDQFIDRTQKRIQTFYDGTSDEARGVLHMVMASPFCSQTRQLLIDTAKELGIKHHTTGTAVTIEGPRFSSKAESILFKSWGAHIINMTTVPEVVLAKEAGLSYAAMALVTDFDCWKDDPDQHVSVENVMKTFKENAEKAVNMILTSIPKIAQQDWSEVIKANQDAVKNCIM